MSEPPGQAAGPLDEVPAGAVAAEMAPLGSQVWEAEAARQRRLAHGLQAGYLLVLLAAPAVRLVPLRSSDRATFDKFTSAVFLLAAVCARLVLRRVAAEMDWVRARREAEVARSAAWRRCALGRPEPSDGPTMQRVVEADVTGRWRFYVRHRIDDQIAYFTDRAQRNRRAASRWKLARLVLTVGTLAVAAASLVLPVPGEAIGLVSALLATTEAWLQFLRSDVLSVSFEDARDELRRLRERTPTDEESLARTVDAVEGTLERERWTWTAIMSLTVLTSAPVLPAKGGGGSG